jgi:hypothetical protein
MEKLSLASFEVLGAALNSSSLRVSSTSQFLPLQSYLAEIRLLAI